MKQTGVGWPRNYRFGAVIGNAFGMARRNPLAVLLMGAGVGWLVHAMRNSTRNSSWPRRMGAAERIPVLNTGQARIYNPDASPLHPMQDLLESRREMSARI